MSPSYNICACSDCPSSHICLTKIACFSATGPTHCANNKECFGCINNITIYNLKCSIPNTVCCQHKFLCNINRNQVPSTHIVTQMFTVLLTLIAFLSAVCFFVYLIWFLRFKKQKYKSVLLTNKKSKVGFEPQFESLESTTTGTGPGELIQRTIARDIRINTSRGALGQGRFGSVWLAKWHNDPVAVKLFPSVHEGSWIRETQIYSTPMIRHDNILGFIAADIKETSQGLGMILVTEYHPNNSLFDYLNFNRLDKYTFFRFIYSVCNGLNHLHQEIVSAGYKPAIAHRDLKSKNILVKKNMECCLADFGMSVRYDSQLNKIDKAGSVREGSVRYMAPEILSESIQVGCIESLKRADVYAYGLVVWECVRRCWSDEEYMVPYGEFVVEGCVEFEVVRDVVCKRKCRPEIGVFLKPSDQMELKQMVEVMQECWMEKADGRLNCLNIKKRLKKIFSSFE